MKTFATLTLLAGFVVLGTGCVSQNEADAWQRKYRAAEETILDLRQQLDDRDDELALLRGDKSELAALRKSLAEAQEALRNAGNSPLPTVLISELAQLAAANPDLMTFDAETGMIRFRSDVTFALGSIAVSDQARGLIGQLAGVLNSPAAAPYEVRVVGHTDNVPVTNAANRQKFEDNWGLSAFRAIAVMRVLKSAGVNEARMGVGGYGQQQPVAPNGNRGAEANRRVELYLVPPPPPPATDDAPAPAPSASVVPMDNPAPADNTAPAMFK